MTPAGEIPLQGLFIIRNFLGSHRLAERGNNAKSPVDHPAMQYRDLAVFVLA